MIPNKSHIEATHAVWIDEDGRYMCCGKLDADDPWSHMHGCPTFNGIVADPA